MLPSLRKLIFVVGVWLLGISAIWGQITITILSDYTICQNSSVVVTINSIGTYGPSNVYSIELSDEDGDFNSPTQIGSIPSPSNGPLDINLLFSPLVPYGTNYRIRARSSDPPDIVSDTVGPITIYSLYPGAHSTTEITVCDGYHPPALTFTTTPSGGLEPYTYQWYENVTLVGTAESYDPGPLSAGPTGTDYVYYCLVTDACGQSLPTASKTIHVLNDAIVSISGGGTFCQNDPVTLQAGHIAGTGTISYQWQYGTDGIYFPFNVGTNSETYDPPTNSPGQLYYRVHFTINGAACNDPYSSAVSVIVVEPPTTAAAGADQTGAATCGSTTVTLAANSPAVGTGSWSIVSGAGGAFADASSPTSTFTGVAGASYTLRWTISNPPCTASYDDVVITFNQIPTPANAGADQTGAATCGSTTVILAANSPTVGTGSWSIVSGAGGAFADASSPTSTFTGVAGASYTLRWTISNPPCIASTDDIVITFNQIPTPANAGPDQTGAATCGSTTITLAANSPTAGTGSWSILSGAGGSFVDASSPSSAFSGTAGTAYTLRWTISNVPCAPSSDDVNITFNQRPTTVITPDPAALCAGGSLNMNGNPVGGSGTYLPTCGQVPALLTLAMSTFQTQYSQEHRLGLIPLHIL